MISAAQPRENKCKTLGADAATSKEIYFDASDEAKKEYKQQKQILRESMAYKAAYCNLEEITKRVGAIRDKSQKQLLHDASRNNSIKRVVYYKLHVLTIFDADDFVLYHSGTNNRIGWFLKCLSHPPQQCLERWEQEMLQFLNKPDARRLDPDSIYRPLWGKMNHVLDAAHLLVVELMRED